MEGLNMASENLLQTLRRALSSAFTSKSSKSLNMKERLWDMATILLWLWPIIPAYFMGDDAWGVGIYAFIIVCVQSFWNVSFFQLSTYRLFWGHPHVGCANDLTKGNTKLETIRLCDYCLQTFGWLAILMCLSIADRDGMTTYSWICAFIAVVLAVKFFVGLCRSVYLYARYGT
ncbi:MAG: hypothetical protein ACI8QY_000076 [bacterium]|jgi:hypothetical protein